MVEMDKSVKSLKCRFWPGCLLVAIGLQLAPMSQAEIGFSLGIGDWANSTDAFAVSRADLSTVSYEQSQAETAVYFHGATFEQEYEAVGEGVSNALWAIMFEDGVQFLTGPNPNRVSGMVGVNGWIIKRTRGDLSIQFKF